MEAPHFRSAPSHAWEEELHRSLEHTRQGTVSFPFSFSIRSVSFSPMSIRVAILHEKLPETLGLPSQGSHVR